MSKPTKRSDTARLASKILAAECREGVLQSVSRIAMLPKEAVIQKMTFTVQNAIT